MNEVTPGYFETMGMRLLEGRDFDGLDRHTGTPAKVIVNQAFARRFFPGRDPLGQRFGFAGPGGLAKADDEIAGVVSDAKYRSLREEIPPTVYRPIVAGFTDSFILHLRTKSRPDAMIGQARALLHSLDPALPPIEIRTLREEVEASLWQERLLAMLSAAFGAIAALLAGIGLYGVLDYSVKLRAREIGVRVALGAAPAEIAALLSKEAGWITLAGLTLGLAGYAITAAWIRRALYDLHVWEPFVVLGVVILVGTIAASSTLPAMWRALRVDPAIVLRGD